MTNDVTYSVEIENQIISYLDGWFVVAPVTEDEETSEEVTDEVETTTETTEETTTEETTTTTNEDSGIEPFITTTELTEKHNKTITRNECRLFYEETLSMSYIHTNRLNIDDLTTVEADMYIRAVCKWTASNLWNKYNIRVNNEDMEDTYIQSYGGLLYKSALKGLQPFINQRINSVSKIKQDNANTDDDIWIV